MPIDYELHRQDSFLHDAVLLDTAGQRCWGDLSQSGNEHTFIEETNLSFGIIAECSDILHLAGSATFSSFDNIDCTDYSQCIGFADDGIVSSVHSGFNVDFNIGQISDGHLKIETIVIPPLLMSAKSRGVISSDGGRLSIPWCELKAGPILIKGWTIFSAWHSSRHVYDEHEGGQSGVWITLLAGYRYFPNIQCLGWVEGPINTGLYNALYSEKVG